MIRGLPIRRGRFCHQISPRLGPLVHSLAPKAEGSEPDISPKPGFARTPNLQEKKKKKQRNGDRKERERAQDLCRYIKRKWEQN